MLRGPFQGSCAHRWDVGKGCSASIQLESPPTRGRSRIAFWWLSSLDTRLRSPLREWLIRSFTDDSRNSLISGSADQIEDLDDYVPRSGSRSNAILGLRGAGEAAYTPNMTDFLLARSTRIPLFQLFLCGGRLARECGATINHALRPRN